MIPNVFRPHPDGTATDVFEDESTWVRDGEASSVRALDGNELELHDVPTSFEGMRALLKQEPHRGLIFGHVDGRQAQVTRNDFGLPTVDGD